MKEFFEGAKVGSTSEECAVIPHDEKVQEPVLGQW